MAQTGYNSSLNQVMTTSYGSPSMYGIAVDQQNKFYTFVHDNAEGRFKCFDDQGNVSWTYVTDANAECTPAISSDGTIYLLGGKHLYAIYGGSGLAPGPWPRKHGSNRNSRNAGW